MVASPTVTLNNGIEIPQLGFGTYQVPPAQARDATLVALEVGYRHIDTAQMYGNERQVGQAIRESGLDRNDVFVTSKLNNGYHAYDDALKAFDRTMDKLDLGYLDLFLIHWPLPAVGDFVETWRAMEAIGGSGRVRAVGVSNFHEPHLRRLLDETGTVPAVNQIEAHPYLVQDELRAFGTSHGIATEAWSPIARGKVNDDPVIRSIAERHGRTPVQVTLRWHLQRGDIVFPKSVTQSRVEENFDVFGFELTDDDVAAITGRNRNRRIGPDPDTFNWVP
jgi:2,5-diketo-D-gluconate reductase A